MHSKWTYIPEGVGKNPQETTCLTTPMTSKTKMESQPLTVDVTLSQNGKGAIFHVNCPSDGNHEGWMEGEEASTQAKQIWLWKLGCMLKIHGNIKCQCLHCSMEITTTIPLHTDSFNNPWCFTLSDFPKGYKLFAVARPSIDVNPQRKDYYLCGMFYFFFSTCYLTDIF